MLTQLLLFAFSGVAVESDGFGNCFGLKSSVLRAPFVFTCQKKQSNNMSRKMIRKTQEIREIHTLGNGFVTHFEQSRKSSQSTT